MQDKKGMNEWFALSIILGWCSIVLFLLDYAERSGDMVYYLWVIVFVLVTVLGLFEKNKKRKIQEVKNN